MTKGFLTTLFAAAVSFAGTTAAFAAAPVISGIPDLQVGDMEDNGATDNNYFVFTNAFQFSTKATDADTTAGALLWSFAEYWDNGHPFGTGLDTDPTQEYQINGKDPIAKGTSQIATETGNGYPNAKAPGANRLNATTDYASFRDIIFSPLADSAPFNTGIGSLNPTQIAYAGTVGKNVVFYVADPEGNLAQDVIRVKTKDQDFDKLSSAWTPTNLGPPFNGWTESGLNAVTPDDVDRADDTNMTTGYETSLGEPSVGKTAIGTIVRASTSRYRILGWTLPTGAIDYPGAGSYVRGKFYVYTNNAAADVTNKYPNFRARLQHGGAYVAVTNFQYGTTGDTGGAAGNFPYADGPTDAAIESAYGSVLRPSRVPASPSLYRVDFDPIDVPAAGARRIIPTFESFAFNDPAAATIMLSKLTVGTYPALTDAQGTQVWSYTRTTSIASQGFDFAAPAAGIGPNAGVSFGAFNAEGDFTTGYKQGIFVDFTGTDPTYAQGTEAVGNTGLMTDTRATNAAYTNRFVVGIIDIQPKLNTSRARIQPGKFYRGRFYATSDVLTTGSAAGTQRQGNLRFRLQTASAVINCYQEFVGAIRTDANTPAGATGVNGYKDGVIGGQALPGTNSQNPDTDPTLTPAGYDGGWYTVLMPTPLDGDIRRDVDSNGNVNATTFGALFTQPGPGSASDSARDLRAGCDVYTNPINLTVSGTTFPNTYEANRAKVALTAVKILEYDASTVTDDGGYQP